MNDGHAARTADDTTATRRCAKSIRLPGLFRLGELDGALHVGGEFQLVRAGVAPEGAPLFAVYFRPGVACSAREAPVSLASVERADPPTSPRGVTQQEGAGTMGVQRRDRSGHIDPGYARGLLARSGRSAGVSGGWAAASTRRRNDPVAEELGERFVAAVTSGEEELRETLGARGAENDGAVVLTIARVEFALGPDGAGAVDAQRPPALRVRGGR